LGDVVRRRLLLTADAAGDTWRYSCDLANALRPLGWEAVIAVLGAALSADQRADANARIVETGLPVDRTADGPEPVLAAGEALATLAVELRADLMQLNHPAFGARAAFPTPVVAVERGGPATRWAGAEGAPLPPDVEWQRELIRSALSRADAAVAPSAAYAADVRRVYDLRVTPLVVHDGRRPMELLGGYTPSGGAFTAGRLWDRAWDLDTLDRAAARTAAPFRAAGSLEGPYGHASRPRHLIALGVLTRQALAAELARRPVFVSASRVEPFGPAVLEAAQAGCPLVLSDIPVFRELWTGAAAFVAPGDAAGFADAVDALAADAFAHAAAGLAAVERARRYTPAATAAAMSRLYDRLLDRRDAA